MAKANRGIEEYGRMRSFSDVSRCIAESEKIHRCFDGKMIKAEKSVLQSAHKSGFTFIELLTATAITSILASILFPVFARAGENVRRSSCSSNLRQVAMGVMQYIHDYDECLAPQDNQEWPPQLHFAELLMPSTATVASLLKTTKRMKPTRTPKAH
jgi:prepilin-type N-terminal cleavage/methylation domain-containing protein